MAIRCEFIDFIIPISNIKKVYAGGFDKFKIDNTKYYGSRIWNDDFLVRDGAMNAYDIEDMIKKWEKLGLKGIVNIDGEDKWQDFCVVESLFGGQTLPCDWIGFDQEKLCVYLKEKPRGPLVGPYR